MHGGNDPQHYACLASFEDMELGREYEIAISNQYIPLHTYTREVDYPDTKVQVSDHQIKNEERSYRFIDESVWCKPDR